MPSDLLEADNTKLKIYFADSKYETLRRIATKLIRRNKSMKMFIFSNIREMMKGIKTDEK